MTLLIATGLRQLKNYMLAHKATMVLSIISAVAIITYLAGMITYGHMLYDYGTTGVYDIFPYAIIFSIVIMLFAFIQADYMQISESEANVFFVSPIKEHKILLYAFIKSSYQIILLLLVFMQLNITLVAPFLGLGPGETLRLFIWEASLFCTLIMSGLFLSLVKKKNAAVFYSLCIISIGLTVWAATKFITGTLAFGAFIPYFYAFFSQGFWQFIPVAGLLAKASGFILNPSAQNMAYMGLIVILNIAFIMSPYYIKVAMGETAIEAAQKNKRRREKKRAQNTSGFKIEKQAKDSKNIRLSGTWAIISKQWIDYGRSSHFFLSGNILLILFIMVIYGAVIKFTQVGMMHDAAMTQEEFALVTSILSFTFMIIIIIMSLIITSNLPKDIANPIIYLLPDKEYKKVLAISYIANFENLIKALLISGFMYFMGMALPLSLCTGTIYFFLVSTATFVDMFSYSVFGKLELGFLKFIFSGMIKMIILFLYVGIYLAVCFIETQGDFSPVSLWGVFVIALMALAIDAGIISLSGGLVDNK